MNLTDYPQSAPAVDLSNLNGKVTLLNPAIGNSTVISGDGTNAQVLGLAVLRAQPAPTDSYFYNNASPAATAGLLNSRQWTTLPNLQSVPTPNQGTIDTTFVTSMIAQARGDHAPMLTPIANGVSDVRLFRVNAGSGTNSILLAPAPIATTVIESAGSTSLVQLGNNYFLYPVGGSSGPELSYSGAPVVAGEFGSWTPLGAEQTASGYEVAWKATGTDQYSVWVTDSSGSYISNNGAGAPAVAGTSSALEMLEPSFHQDLNGDGVIGLAVMSGGTVEVSSAYSGPATFMGSSGILQLDQSASFSGTVAGMTGQDTLDLRDISFATIQSPTYSGTSTGGTLSVSDGTHNAQI